MAQTLGNPVAGLFTSAQSAQGQIPIVDRGSVIAFHYTGQTMHRVNDPYPLVVVASSKEEIEKYDTVRGVNLHYLTLPTVRQMMASYGNNRQFSYTFIKGQAYIVQAFRSYKRSGITNLKMLDVAFLQNVLKVVRALNPGEIEAMRAQIQQQMQKYPVIQPQAAPTPVNETGDQAQGMTGV